MKSRGAKAHPSSAVVKLLPKGVPMLIARTLREAVRLFFCLFEQSLRMSLSW